MVKDFEFDSEKGIWRNSFLGDREIFFGTTKFRALFSGLEERFGSAAGFIFQGNGVSMGEALGQMLETEETKLEAVEGIFNNAFEAGWGRFEIPSLTEEMLDSKETLKLRIDNNFFADLCVERSASPCHFLRGILKGLFNEVRNVEQKCEILECSLETQSFCEFEIGPL